MAHSTIRAAGLGGSSCLSDPSSQKKIHCIHPRTDGVLSSEKVHAIMLAKSPSTDREQSHVDSGGSIDGFPRPV